MENVATVFSEYLSSFKVGQPLTCENLALYPIKTSAQTKSFHFLTLGEAHLKGMIKIREISEGGSVPQLMVTNEADQLVFMMDGEELIGAKQNRIINASIMVDARSRTVIPVSCIEQGRWSRQSQWMNDGVVCHPKLRREKMKSVHASLAHFGDFVSDQGGVWNEVHDKLDKLKVISTTSNMDDGFKAKRREINSFLRNLSFPTGSLGVVLVINGRIYCADLFDSPETFQKMWKKLISSYALEAISKQDRGMLVNAAKEEDVLKFLQSPDKMELEEYKSPGIGRDIRFDGEEAIGSALLCRDVVVHLGMFKPRKRRAERREYPRRPYRGRGYPRPWNIDY